MTGRAPAAEHKRALPQLLSHHAEGVRRAWWLARKNGYSPEFQKFLLETKPPEKLSTLNELFG